MAEQYFRNFSSIRCWWGATRSGRRMSTHSETRLDHRSSSSARTSIMRNLKEINVVQEITFRSLVFGFWPFRRRVSLLFWVKTTFKSGERAKYKTASMFGAHNHNIYSIATKCRSRPKNTNWKGKNCFFYAEDKVFWEIPQLILYILNGKQELAHLEIRYSVILPLILDKIFGIRVAEFPPGDTQHFSHLKAHISIRPFLILVASPIALYVLLNLFPPKKNTKKAKKKTTATT